MDELVELRTLCCLINLRLGGALDPAVADVVLDRRVEHDDVLRHHPNRAADGPLGQCARVLAVDEDLPRGGVVEAEQQPCDRRLARARGAHERHGVAAGHPEGHVPQGTTHGLLAVVEADVPELHHGLSGPRRQVEGQRAGLVLHLRRLGQQLAEALHVDEGVDDHVVDCPEEVERREDVDDVRIHGNEVTQAAMVLEDARRGDDHAARHGEVHDNLL
mmetsp:Transcript_58131/g.180071  ORF Transcript_58131/g.180071 Transcript_58131/m.180071 type:complete len:218 (-) Transcript_58131:1044-1697(-)